MAPTSPPLADGDPSTPPSHGMPHAGGVCIDSYSLDVEDADGLVGDQASQTAFREVLKDWQAALERAGAMPFGTDAVDALSNDELDRIAADGDAQAAHAVILAVDEFSSRLSYVIHRFLRQDPWAGVERIVVGGGFKESAIGRFAIQRTQQRLADDGVGVALRPLRHGADDGGLVGWNQLHAHPAEEAFLAVDIGGTHVRCGIVKPTGDRGGAGDARVLQREKWRHADHGAPQADLVEGIVEMLRRLVAHAEAQRIPLRPFIGIGCPGVIREDGSIERGAQNLPEDWQRASFHLPRRIQENIPTLANAETCVLMHNDAVVQGLSESPFTQDVRRWAALTIGTGLGNASFTNRP
jgi:hypothetical protein